jgi:hypothetical protein
VPLEYDEGLCKKRPRLVPILNLGHQMLVKRLSEVRVEDVERLKEDGVSEGQYIDFKSEPLGTNYEAKKEFLADITSFANASGGDLVFGVKEKDGVAFDAPGINLKDPDAEKLRIGALIRDGIEPRLASFDMHWLPREGEPGFLIVRVPRSWAAPHRVTLQGHDKFYVRDGGGKHPMNVDELRRAFSLADSVTSRIRQFRLNRVRDILGESPPISMMNGPKLVVHVVPMGAFVQPPRLNFDTQTHTIIVPIAASSGFTGRPTFEGYISYTPGGGAGIRAFTLAFREGMLELVATVANKDESTKVISLQLNRDLIKQAWMIARNFHARFAIDPPHYVLISFLGVRGYESKIGFHGYAPGATPSRHDSLYFPEIYIDHNNYDKDFDTLFHDSLHVLANAFGLESWPHE